MNRLFNACQFKVDYFKNNHWRSCRCFRRVTSLKYLETRSYCVHHKRKCLGKGCEAPIDTSAEHKKASSVGYSKSKKGSVKRLSGMQRSILSLYRKFLRIGYQKTDFESKKILILFVRTEFRKHKNLDKWNFSRIEYLIHKGTRQLEALEKCKRTDKFQFYQP